MSLTFPCAPFARRPFGSRSAAAWRQSHAASPRASPAPRAPRLRPSAPAASASLWKLLHAPTSRDLPRLRRLLDVTATSRARPPAISFARAQTGAPAPHRRVRVPGRLRALGGTHVPCLTAAARRCGRRRRQRRRRCMVSRGGGGGGGDVGSSGGGGARGVHRLVLVLVVVVVLSSSSLYSS